VQYKNHLAFTVDSTVCKTYQNYYILIYQLILRVQVTHQCEISGSHGGKYEVHEPSGMYCHVINLMSTDVSEVHAASIIRAMSEPSAEE
jgi:hypothetical protein